MPKINKLSYTVKCFKQWSIVITDRRNYRKLLLII